MSEEQIQAILDEGRKTRKRPSRTMWIAALVIGALCAGGLAIAFVQDCHTVATKRH